MNKHRIESNLEIPSRSKGGKWRSLVDSMRFGDSVRVDNASDRNGLAIAINTQSNAKSVSRQLADGGYRVWKTEKTEQYL